MRVLILLASFGDGHRQASNALLEQFSKHPDVQTQAVDPFRGTNPFIAKINEYIYEWSTKYFPLLYGLSYDVTNVLTSSNPLWRLLAVFSRKATWAAVCEYQPDVVIQLFPDHALAKFPRELRYKPLTVAVLTDFSVHVRWFHRNIERYYLPCATSAKDAKRHMVHTDTCLEISGIPIRNQFRDVKNRDGDQHHPSYIVLSAGGRGVFPDLSFVIRLLAKHFERHQIVVMCGRNEAMQRQVERTRVELRLDDDRVQAIGFVDDVASLLAGAAFVVAKAGGISIAESLACTTPMLFYRPFSGQERRNAEIVEKMGAGRIVVKKRKLPDVLAGFHGDALHRMRKACEANAYPDASTNIVANVLRLAKGR